MAERIAHLGALRAFEAAARHLSFQKAAEELGLTPSAISHQIRTLETYLDARLFERRTRAVALTEAGQALLPGVGDGFRQIESAVRQVRSLRNGAVIVVTTGPSFASKWLVPRLYTFEEENPQIEVRITTTARMIDLTREDVDVAIRHGRGPYEGLQSVRLFGEAYAPICSPAVADSLDGPEALAAQRLLYDDSTALPGPVPDWEDWFKEAGVSGKAVQQAMANGRHVKQTDHGLQAAIDGVGVLFGRLAIAAPDMVAGRLVQPFGPTLPSPYGYHFVTRPDRLREKPMAAFLAWLQAQVAQIPGVPD